jgi:predicted anti-sigma-YlaC factor YlaD
MLKMKAFFLMLSAALVFSGCMSSPTVVGLALPHIIKSDEKKLVRQPENEELRLEAGSYNVMYANAFIEGPAKMLPPEKFEERDAELLRAKGFYLKGVFELRGGLEQNYPGINGAGARGGLSGILAQMRAADVPWLYWTVAGTLAAYSIDPMDLDLGLKIPELTLFINRAYELDPDYNNGALDDFFILFYGSLPPTLGGDREKAVEHYRLALEKSKGLSPSPYVSYAEAIAIPAQDYPAFKSNLEKALAVDIGKIKVATDKLAAKLSQRRARYLLDNADLFIVTENNDETE